MVFFIIGWAFAGEGPPAKESVDQAPVRTAEVVPKEEALKGVPELCVPRHAQCLGLVQPSEREFDPVVRVRRRGIYNTASSWTVVRHRTRRVRR